MLTRQHLRAGAALVAALAIVTERPGLLVVSLGLLAWSYVERPRAQRQLGANDANPNGFGMTPTISGTGGGLEAQFGSVSFSGGGGCGCGG